MRSIHGPKYLAQEPMEPRTAFWNRPKLCCDVTLVNCVMHLKWFLFQPSRELAEQTFNQIVKFKKHLENPRIKDLLVVGGIQIKDQIAALNAGVSIFHMFVKIRTKSVNTRGLGIVKV